MKISVITINLNRRDELRRTLESLRLQIDREFELVVVDGGSTDGSLEVLDQYANLISDRRSEKDAGIFDAWNKGILLSSGDVVALLNAGDEYHPKVVSQIKNFYENERVEEQDVVIVGRTLLVDGGRVAKVIGNKPRLNPLLGIGFAHPGMIVPRGVYEKVGLYENLSIASDTQFILRCIKAGIIFRPVALTVYMDSSGISQSAAVTGFRQYCDALEQLGFCSKQSAKVLRISYGVYRMMANSGALRPIVSLAANARHFAIRLMNVCQRIAFFRPARQLALWCMRMDVHSSAFVSPSVTFYRTGNLLIGEKSVINRGAVLDNRDRITIGKGCSISFDVRILTAGHDIDSPYFEYYSKPVVIEDHVCVFAGATISPGTILRRGVVVLSGATISGDTVENGIYGGVPARFVRTRVSTPRHMFDYHRPFAL